MDLIDELHSRVLCGDGAMGTALMEVADAPFERCLEEFCLSAPDVVTKIHAQYIDAGARVIETNSFGANAARLERHGLEGKVREINRAAAHLARQAARGKDVYVAGSVGPLGFTADEARERNIDRRAVFHEQIGALLDGGVDLIFFETFLDLDELTLALEVKQSLQALPALCSLACAEEGRLPDGRPITEAFAQSAGRAGRRSSGSIASTARTPRSRLLEHVAVKPGDLLSAYPNAGYPRYLRGAVSVLQRAGLFRQDRARHGGAGRAAGRRLLRHGPAQIAAMAAPMRDLAPVTSKLAVRPIEPPPVPERNTLVRNRCSCRPSPTTGSLARAEAEETSILDLHRRAAKRSSSPNSTRPRRWTWKSSSPGRAR